MVSEEQNSAIELASEVVPVPEVHPEIQLEIETLEVIDVNNVEASNIHHGKVRHRKKALHATILKQMEFYFGDANLSKDRFLADLIKQDPNIDLEIFLRFNKIRSLTTDINRIIKAIKKSTMLQVSEDGTKVCRVTPIVEKENIDECTIYVQRLPLDADHEWLTTLFSEYGPVSYISIPKFKYNHKIKGFAFVEFETPESAKKCLKAFRAKGCELSSQTLPTDVLSITTYEEEKQQNNDFHNFENSIENNYDKKINGNNVQKVEKSLESEKSKMKRKKKRSIKSEDPSDSGTDLSEVPKSKKKKLTDNDNELNTYFSDSNAENEKRSKKRKNTLSSEGVYDSDLELQKNLTEGCRKQKKLKNEHAEVEANQISINLETMKRENQEETVEYLNEENTSEKKRKKKRKRKHHGTYEILETADMGFQVMSKKDWKKLRNKYLDLQKSKMKHLKQHMRRARWNQWGDRNKVEVEHEENIGNKKEKQTSNLDFIPGVIVKVNLNEPCVDPKGFKVELKNNTNIKYIDVKEGSSEAFIRCDSSENAIVLIKKSNDTRQFKVLVGAEEKSYWDKIFRNRKEKIDNKIRVKQRGRDKLLKKAEKELGKHIKFDEV